MHSDSPQAYQRRWLFASGSSWNDHEDHDSSHPYSSQARPPLPGSDEDVSHLSVTIAAASTRDHVIIESKTNNQQRRKNCKVTVDCWHCDKVARSSASTPPPQAATTPRFMRSSAKRQEQSVVVLEESRIKIERCPKNRRPFTISSFNPPLW